MAKPTDTLPWATDPGATSDPGPTRKATGFLAGKRLPAKWLNYLLNKQGAWFNYLANLHIETEFLNKSYDWLASHSWGDASIGYGLVSAGQIFADTFSYRNPSTIDVVLPVEQFSKVPAGSNWMSDTNGNGVNSEGQARGRWSFRLPTGTILRDVHAYVSQAVGTTMTLEVHKARRNTVAPYSATRTQLGITITRTDDGAADLSPGTLDDTSDSSLDTYQVDIYASSAGCTVRALFATIEPQGPRSF